MIGDGNLQTIKYYNLKIFDYEIEGEVILCDKNFTYIINLKKYLKMIWPKNNNKITHLGRIWFDYYWIEVSEETLILDDFSRY